MKPPPTQERSAPAGAGTRWLGDLPGHPGTALRRWFAAPDGDWSRPVVATVLALLLLGMPHHRLVVWLSDSTLLKYWKELVFAGACLAYAAAVARRRGLTRAERRALLWGGPFLLAGLVRLLVGVVRQEDSHLLLVGGGSLLFYVPTSLLAIYLLETASRSPARQVGRILYWLLVATSLAAVLSIVDNLFHISEAFDFLGRLRVEARLDYDANVWRSSATYQSPMVLGMITGTGFLISLYLFLTGLGDRPRRWGALAVFGGLVGLHLVGLYLTFSRGPLVACTGGTVVLALFRGHGIDLRGLAAGWRKVVAGIVATGLALALVVVLLPPALQGHLASIFDWSGDQNNSTRLRRMAIGVERFAEEPLIGQGLGTAQGRLANYRIEELGHDYFFTNPESQLLTWGMEGGLMLLLPGLVVMAFMIHTAFAMASHPRRRELRQLGVLFLGLQAALYAEALIMPILNGRTFQLGFWSLFGALVVFRGELDEAGPGLSAVTEEAGTNPRAAES